MAEDAARELSNLPLDDALQLVRLYAERGSVKATTRLRVLRLPDPMLSRAGPLPSGSRWSFELKWDGCRKAER
jgi:ATP-dependent DNA ligase